MPRVKSLARLGHKLLALLGISWRPGVPHSGPAKAKANGLEIAYETFGRESNPAILLVMGFAQSMVEWDVEFCTRLASHGFRVIRFDNRDAGRSSRADKGTYKLGDMAEDAAGLLDALRIKRAHLVGVSMGGMIAQILAASHPERALSLTSIMSTTGDALLPPPTPQAMQALMRRAPSDREGFIAHCRDIWRILRGREFPQDEARDRARAELLFDYGVDPEGASRQLIAVSISGSRKRLLKSVACPTLVIHGEADPLLPVAHGIATAEAIPGAKLKVIPQMGHAMPVEFWDELIDAIAGHCAHAGDDRIAA